MEKKKVENNKLVMSYYVNEMAGSDLKGDSKCKV
jgi:hypothetical protein